MSRSRVRGFFITFIIGITILLGSFFYLINKEWVDFSLLECYSTVQPSVILDCEGQEITRFALDKRTPVTYDKMPPILIKAFVAAEDHDFFKHSGISVRGIMRSALVNFYHRRVVQGASTISQQLVKLMFLTYDRTFYRKFQEVFLAFQLERQLSKEQIMELYLNNIYFGRGIYGVEAACQRLWNKPLAELTIEQAASLAAVAKSAFLYSPLNAPKNAIKRRNIILQSMKNLGFITQQEYDKATKIKLEINDHITGNPIRLYIQDYVRQWAENKWGREALYRNGLRIKTTIDLEMQTKAEQAFATIVYGLHGRMGNTINGGMVTLEACSGKVKVMIGGIDFRKSQYNRAVQARRQIGSTIKPILYALALKAGVQAGDVYIDEPLELETAPGQIWKPKNWSDDFEGPMTVARSLTLSVNTIAVQLLLKVGTQNLIRWSRLFGLPKDLPDYPSIALGTPEVTVEQSAAAFNVFANNGVYVKPTIIEWVKDSTGTKLWEADYEQYRVVDSIVNSKIINMLSHRMNMAQKLSKNGWINGESIGKTGTTNGKGTTWFVGATPELTTAIYLGHDNNKPLGLYANSTTFPIWVDFHKSISSSSKKKHFYIDPSLKEVSINWITGDRSDDIDNENVIKILR